MEIKDDSMTAVANPFQKFELRRSKRPQSSTVTTTCAATAPSLTRAAALQSTFQSAADPGTPAALSPEAAVSVPVTPATSVKRRRSVKQEPDVGPAAGPQGLSQQATELQEPPKEPSPAAAAGKKKAPVNREGAVGMREKLGDPVQPLRMIIVGHNPSETTWRLGHAYAHPSNHMWRLLIRTGIAPEGIKSAQDDDKMPSLAGVGFSDVGTGHPGTESSSFKSDVFLRWSENFYQRMRHHIAAASQAIGCTCGQCGAPSMIAFAGKRQFLELLNIGKKGKQKVKSVDVGKWDPSVQPDVLPADWPFPATTEVWVCTSTSGAAVLTNEQREAPYRVVSERLKEVPWPRTDVPNCKMTS